MFSSQVGAFMKENSVFITSGVIASREDEVRQSFYKNGFEIIEENRDADWFCFVCRKRKEG